MSETLLNRLLCEEIEVAKCIEWLKTGNEEDLSDQFPCVRADFVIYFTNYLRNQTECVLRSTSTVTGDSLLNDTKPLAESPAVASPRIGENFNRHDATYNSTDYSTKEDSQNVYYNKDIRKKVNTRLFHEDSGQSHNNQSYAETAELNHNNQISFNEVLLTPKHDRKGKSSVPTNFVTTPNNLSNKSDRRYAVSTPLKASSLDTSLFETPTKNSSPASSHLFSPISSAVTDVRVLGTANWGNFNRNVPPSESFHYGHNNRHIAPHHLDGFDPTGALQIQRSIEYNSNQRKSSDNIDNHFSTKSGGVTDVRTLGMTNRANANRNSPLHQPEGLNCYRVNKNTALQNNEGFNPTLVMQGHRPTECNPLQSNSSDNVEKILSPNSTTSDGCFDVSSTAKGQNANVNFHRNARARPNIYVADFISSAPKNTVLTGNNTHGSKKKRHVKYVNMSLDEDLINKKMFSSNNAEPFNEKLNIKDSDMFPEIGSKRRDAKQSHNSNRRINPTRLNSTNPDSDNSAKSDSNSLNSRSVSRTEATEFGVKYHEKIEQNEAFKSVHTFKTAEYGTAFQEERSILKREREKVMEKFSLINSRSEKMPKIQSPLVISKQTISNSKVEITFVQPDPAKVLDLKMLNILADIYDAMLNFNLIVNVTSEIYFLISLIVSQQIINTCDHSITNRRADEKNSQEIDNKSVEHYNLSDLQIEDVQKSIENIDIKDIVGNINLSITGEGKDVSCGSVKFTPSESVIDSARMFSIKPLINEKTQDIVGENITNPTNQSQIKSSHLSDSKDVSGLTIDKENIDTHLKPSICILKRPPTKIPEGISVKNNTELNTSIKNTTALIAAPSDGTLLPSDKLLKTVHDCVYFALATLYRQKSSLRMFLDKSCLRILLQNDRVKQFLPLFVDVLAQLQNDDASYNDKECGFTVSEISNKNVYFSTETDSVDNFPAQQNFFAFKRQRDSFYEIFRCWESNSASGGNFAYSMETQVQRLLGLDYSPANMSHLARLFRDQLLATCATAHKENSLEALAKLQSAIGSQLLSHNRLSKLSERLTGALPGQKSDTGIFEPPNFDKEQVFFRDFIIYARGSNFRVHLIDSLVQAIIKLDHTAFPCLEREDNGTRVDGETKSQYLQCLKSLQILGKFLGFAMALPYCVANKTVGNNSDKNLTTPPTEKVLEGEITVRSWTQPPINLSAHLHRSLKDRRLILTIPWLVQVLAMLDYTSLRLPYFKALINQLIYIYIGHLFLKPNETTVKKISVNKQSYSKISKKNVCMSNNTRLVLKISIGWLFDLPKFPKDMFYDYLRTLKISSIHNTHGNSSTVNYRLPNGNLLKNKAVENDHSKKKSVVDKSKDGVTVENDNSACSNNANSVKTEHNSLSFDINTDDKSENSKESNTSNNNIEFSANKPTLIIANNSDEIMPCDIIPLDNSEEIEAFASLDCLSLVDKDVITELCPHLKHLRNLLASGIANKMSSGDDNTNTFRHITPVTSGLDGQAAKRKEAELQSQLEEWFLRSQPSGTRRIIQLVSERVGSALTGMARSQLPAHREGVTKESHLLIIDMNEEMEINLTSLCAAVTRLREQKSKAFVKRCVRAATILGKARCQSALSGLLPYDIPDTAAKQLVHICTRRACNLLKRALNDEIIYLTDVPTEVKRLSGVGLSKRQIMEMKQECLESDKRLDEIVKDHPGSSTVCAVFANPVASSKNKYTTSPMTLEGKANKEIGNFDDWFKSAFDAIVQLKDVVIAIIGGDLEQSEESKLVKNAIESARACSQCTYIGLITKKTIAQLTLDLAIMIISTHPATLKEFFEAFAIIWQHCLFSCNSQSEDSCQTNDFTPEEMSQFTTLVCGASIKIEKKTKEIVEKSKSSPEKKRSVSLRSGKKDKNKKNESVDSSLFNDSDIVPQSSGLNIDTVKDYDSHSSKNENITSSIKPKHIKSNYNADDLIENTDRASANRSLQTYDKSAPRDNVLTSKDDKDSCPDELPENEFFDSILCSRNLAILSSSNSGLLVWEALSDFIIFLLDKKFLSEDSLTEQCLALYRQEWPQIILQNLAHCCRLVSEKRHSSSSDTRFKLFLQFLSEFCHNLDQEYF